ncbi:hypothetical protein RhiirA4_472980 [Rhizophagus irregularis]|uniref:Fido domain-containing protein n=1 Tax=Rhizophagus irregularis TaxID=588596 RepID=A0A2I1H5Y5_9GLOM|nr:hypothetical protein RhiirA4_472980 [Rhizophagus irregularis]
MHINLLKEIDVLEATTKISSVDFLRRMTVSFTQQSCSLKGNALGLAVTREVWNSLTGLYDDLDKMLEYQLEVPALTEKFIQFRNEFTKNPSGIHHLIIACRILSAFLHIHPFINDN